MTRANLGKARPAGPPAGVAPPVVVHVRGLTNFAHNAGLRPEVAEQILIEAPQWRYPELYCSAECGRQPHVIVDHAWEDRSLLYCCACGLADLWV